MAICIFAGTFNPIHEAHLKMANYALKKYGFEKIIFIPSYIPPHKDINKNLANHRYKMVELAIKSNPKFCISDIEYRSEGKSYTLITVKKIKEMYNIEGRINFIIGTDAFKNIRSWYKVDELKNIVHFIVFRRDNDTINQDEYNDFSFELADMEQIDISSTELREHKKDGTTEEVKDYIVKNGLYD